jgi:hypothetical protein
MKPTRIIASALLAMAAMLRGATARGLNVPRHSWWERQPRRDRKTILRRQRQWREWAAGTFLFPPGWGDCATAQSGGPVPRRLRRGNKARKASRKRAAAIRRRQADARFAYSLRAIGRRLEQESAESGRRA